MKAVLKYAIVVAAGLLLAGCGYKVNYSLSGASIPPDAKTFSVAYFPNNAPMVAPILSSTLTDALRDKFMRQTRLTQGTKAAISLSKARSPVILRRRLRFRVRPKRPC